MTLQRYDASKPSDIAFTASSSNEQAAVEPEIAKDLDSTGSDEQKGNPDGGPPAEPLVEPEKETSTVTAPCTSTSADAISVVGATNASMRPTDLEDIQSKVTAEDDSARNLDPVVTALPTTDPRDDVSSNVTVILQQAVETDVETAKETTVSPTTTKTVENDDSSLVASPPAGVENSVEDDPSQVKKSAIPSLEAGSDVSGGDNSVTPFENEEDQGSRQSSTLQESLENSSSVKVPPTAEKDSIEEITSEKEPAAEKDQPEQVVGNVGTN